MEENNKTGLRIKGLRGKFIPLILIPLILTPLIAKADIPILARKLKPLVIREVRYIWGKEQDVSYFMAQIHQESGWEMKVESIKGAKGLAQFMPSTAKWISELYPAALGENNPFDPYWAIRALVRYDRWLYERAYFAREEIERWGFLLSGYNGGWRWVIRDRMYAEEKGADKNKWFGHVERHSKRNRVAFKENRNYPRAILFKWRRLYE
ncbi:MAG: transglycosylase SLT domain-containing protein [Nitrospirota bacterium]